MPWELWSLEALKYYTSRERAGDRGEPDRRWLQPGAL